jgi:hypothetical protein
VFSNSWAALQYGWGRNNNVAPYFMCVLQQAALQTTTAVPHRPAADALQDRPADIQVVIPDDLCMDEADAGTAFTELLAKQLFVIVTSLVGDARVKVDVYALPAVFEKSSRAVAMMTYLCFGSLVPHELGECLLVADLA